MKNKKIISLIFEYAIITFGCFLMAVAFNMFFIPNNIAPGGVSGIATVIYNLTGFPPGIMTLIINIPLFLAGYKILGPVFGFKTLYATFAMGILIDLLSGVSLLTSDLLLSSIFGGILSGAGLGIALKMGATTGGTDLAAAIIHKFKPGASVATIMGGLDVLVVISAGLVSKNAEISLYSMLSIYVFIKAIDFVQEGVAYTKAFLIISDKTSDIAKEILSQLDRGATGLMGKGMYTGKSKDVLLCVVTRSEITKLKEIVHNIDSKAFMIVADVHEAMGEGFKPILKEEK